VSICEENISERQVRALLLHPTLAIYLSLLQFVITILKSSFSVPHSAVTPKHQLVSPGKQPRQPRPLLLLRPMMHHWRYANHTASRQRCVDPYFDPTTLVRHSQQMENIDLLDGYSRSSKNTARSGQRWHGRLFEPIRVVPARVLRRLTPILVCTVLGACRCMCGGCHGASCARHCSREGVLGGFCLGGEIAKGFVVRGTLCREKHCLLGLAIHDCERSGLGREERRKAAVEGTWLTRMLSCGVDTRLGRLSLNVFFGPRCEIMA
jgi:hypothetical protein